MQKINFKNLPDTSTPLNASTLNQMQDNIENALFSGDYDDLTNKPDIPEGIPAGTINIYAGSTAPTGYMICDGSAVSRTTYSDLFDAIGTTYGTGDGSTTFNLPNLKGRVAVGLDSNDTDFDTLGETGGSKYLQEHTHKYNISTSGATGSNGTRLTVWNGSGSTYDNASGAIANAGTGNGGNLQPYIVLNYIIKY